MSEFQIIPIEAQQKAQESKLLSKQYDDFQITTAGTYALAGENLKAVKAKRRRILF